MLNKNVIGVSHVGGAPKNSSMDPLSKAFKDLGEGLIELKNNTKDPLQQRLDTARKLVNAYLAVAKKAGGSEAVEFRISRHMVPVAAQLENMGFDVVADLKLSSGDKRKMDITVNSLKIANGYDIKNDATPEKISELLELETSSDKKVALLKIQTLALLARIDKASTSLLMVPSVRNVVLADSITELSSKMFSININQDSKFKTALKTELYKVADSINKMDPKDAELAKSVNQLVKKFSS